MAKQPTKQQAAPGKRKPSRTAAAMQLVNDGMSVRNAAVIYGITPQSIYRLMEYRRNNPACPVCGR